MTWLLCEIELSHLNTVFGDKKLTYLLSFLSAYFVKKTNLLSMLQVSREETKALDGQEKCYFLIKVII